MKIRLGISPFVVLIIVLLGFAVVFPSPTAGQTIHALLIIDDANPINATRHQAGKDKMERLFLDIKHTAGIPYELSELRSNVDEDSPEWMSGGNILKWIGERSGRSDSILKWIADREVYVNRDDIVFVYFSGDGGAHRTTRELYCYLPGNSLGGNKFDRKVLADAVGRIPCRLKILLTDTGSSGVPISRPYASFFVETRLDESSTSLKKAYTNLFLDHAGFLNVAGAVEGEFALGDTEGGIFTRAFVDVMLYPGGGFIWEGVLNQTAKKMDYFFRAFLDSPKMPQGVRDILTEVGQQSQRPKYFEFPRRIMREE